MEKLPRTFNKTKKPTVILTLGSGLIYSMIIAIT